MQTVLKVAQRPLLVAGLAALAVAGVFSGAALAGGPAYTVAVTIVPRNVAVNGTFKVTAKGVSANTSVLEIFINQKRACSSTAAKDASFATNSLKFGATVVHSYSHSKTFRAVLTGTHYACAYLNSVPPLSPPLPRAHAGESYTVG